MKAISSAIRVIHEQCNLWFSPSVVSPSQQLSLKFLGSRFSLFSGSKWATYFWSRPTNMQKCFRISIVVHVRFGLTRPFFLLHIGLNITHSGFWKRCNYQNQTCQLTIPFLTKRDGEFITRLKNASVCFPHQVSGFQLCSQCSFWFQIETDVMATIVKLNETHTHSFYFLSVAEVDRCFIFGQLRKAIFCFFNFKGLR